MLVRHIGHEHVSQFNARMSGKKGRLRAIGCRCSCCLIGANVGGDHGIEINCPAFNRTDDYFLNLIYCQLGAILQLWQTAATFGRLWP